MNVVRSVAIKTHQNADGTYDASIGGERMGLKCLFYVSARVQALRAVAVRFENEGIEAVELLSYDDVWDESKWIYVPVSVFLGSVTRIGADMRYNTDHHGRRGVTMYLNGMNAELWMLKLSDASRL